MRFSDLSARFNSRLDLQKNVIAMRFGDDEAMIMSNDEKSGLLEVKLMCDRTCNAQEQMKFR